MKTFSRSAIRRAAGPMSACIALGVGACRANPTAEPEPIEDASQIVITSPPGTPRPPFTFSDEQTQLLDQIERGAFLFFWEAVEQPSGMVVDRTSNDLISVAGVGFQLSALPIGVERGWITREQGRDRALRILNALESNEENRRDGLFFHILDGSGAPHPQAWEHVVSTIDSAILFAGMITASSYFQDDVATSADRLLADADWTAFLAPDTEHPAYQGFISLGWKAESDDDLSTGKLLPLYWADAGGEDRLVVFLGVCAPDEEHRLEPERYYQLRRRLGSYEDIGPMFFMPYSGALFISIFDNCWIDYRRIGLDNPQAFGFGQRARIDWWEDARRHVNMHRAKAIENPLGLQTLGPNAWGLSASDGPDGYNVSQLFPNPIPMPGAREDWDIPPASHEAHENWGRGVVAPYAAGASIMFEPEAALAALQHYRSLKSQDGEPLLWRDPSTGGFGFLDAYTYDADDGKPWVATDYVAIDQGPLLLGIENARTGLIWNLFASHPSVQAGMRRLRLERAGDRGKP